MYNQAFKNQVRAKYPETDWAFSVNHEDYVSVYIAASRGCKISCEVWGEVENGELQWFIVGSDGRSGIGDSIEEAIASL